MKNEVCADPKVMSRYRNLYSKAKLVAAVGTPIKSSKDFQRAQKKALEDLQLALLEILIPDMDLSTSYMSKEDLIKVKEDAKKHGIRPVWLTGELDNDS